MHVYLLFLGMGAVAYLHLGAERRYFDTQVTLQNITTAYIHVRLHYGSCPTIDFFFISGKNGLV